MTSEQLQQFAVAYAAAWCTQDPHSVAAFFDEHGSLAINGGAASVGRDAIAAAARTFMIAFPDMIVTLDRISGNQEHAIFEWTLTGTNTGPGGSGRAVKISGREEWSFAANGLIAVSLGHFDAADYDRQLRGARAGISQSSG